MSLSSPSESVNAKTSVFEHFGSFVKRNSPEERDRNEDGSNNRDLEPDLRTGLWVGIEVRVEAVELIPNVDDAALRQNSSARFHARGREGSSQSKDTRDNEAEVRKTGETEIESVLFSENDRKRLKPLFARQRSQSHFRNPGMCAH